MLETRSNFVSNVILQTGEEEFDLGKNPKPLVFVIHTFLSAKIQQLTDNTRG